MKTRRLRVDVPPELAARALFASDRTCCVCRVYGKPIQIHHVDGDPSNPDLENLAVLCLDHHRDTQLRGGFDRKLDSHQVILYRDDWHRLVAQRRAANKPLSTPLNTSLELEVATSVADLLLEHHQYELLASHFDSLGNARLRDKYIELALTDEPSDSSVVELRAMQGRRDLIPADLAARHLERYEHFEDWLQRGRALAKVGRHQESVVDYVRGIDEVLGDGNVFTAAFYLKELSESGLIDELFVLAFREASDAGNLWWQVRALEELGWTEELKELLIRHAETIEADGDPELLMKLAEARGDERQAAELRTRILGSMRLVKGSMESLDDLVVIDLEEGVG